MRIPLLSLFAVLCLLALSGCGGDSSPPVGGANDSTHRDQQPPQSSDPIPTAQPPAVSTCPGNFENDARVVSAQKVLGLRVALDCRYLESATEVEAALSLLSSNQALLASHAYAVQTLVLGKMNRFIYPDSEAMGDSEWARPALMLDTRASDAELKDYLIALDERLAFSRDALHGIELDYYWETADILRQSMAELQPHLADLLKLSPAVSRIAFENGLAYYDDARKKLALRIDFNQSRISITDLLALLSRKLALEAQLGGVVIGDMDTWIHPDAMSVTLHAVSENTAIFAGFAGSVKRILVPEAFTSGGGDCRVQAAEEVTLALPMTAESLQSCVSGAQAYASLLKLNVPVESENVRESRDQKRAAALIAGLLQADPPKLHQLSSIEVSIGYESSLDSSQHLTIGSSDSVEHLISILK